MKLNINTDRLLAELNRLARITDCPPTEDKSLPAPTHAVTRIVFTPRDLEARAWLKAVAKAAGFSVREDPVGNTFIRWEGSEPALGVVRHGIAHATLFRMRACTTARLGYWGASRRCGH